MNPNYPGFQHLAHTLDYSIKASSDTDFTDDDFEYESSTAKLNAEANNINNNNNEEDVEYKIDSVNRLDSVENIQKVFYDKPVFNIPLQCDSLKRNNCDSEVASGSNSNSNQGSDDDFEVVTPHKIHFNIHSDEAVIRNEESGTCNIVGDFGKEVEEELGKLTSDKTQINSHKLTEFTDSSIFFNNKEIEPVVERAIEEELKEAIEKLSTSNDLEPSAAKYNIEPNTEQPFNKLAVEKAEISSVLLQEATTVKQSAANMATMSFIHIPSSNENLKTHFSNSDCGLTITTETFNDNFKAKIPESESLTYTDAYNIKISDAFLSGVHDDIPEVPQMPENFFAGADLNANSKKVIETQSKMEVDFIDEQTIKTRRDSNREYEEREEITKTRRMYEPHKMQPKVEEPRLEEIEKFCKEDKTKDDKEKDEDTVIPRKKEKMETNYVKKRRDYSQQFGSLITVPRREFGGRNRDNLNRRSVPVIRDKKKHSPETLGKYLTYFNLLSRPYKIFRRLFCLLS